MWFLQEAEKISLHQQIQTGSVVPQRTIKRVGGKLDRK